MKYLLLLIILYTTHITLSIAQQKLIIPAADRTDLYFPMLKNKSVAVFANPTSRVGNSHLVDTLIKSGIDVKVIFGPEHGFRGTADAGEHVNNAKDAATGIDVISLYGDHKKPTKQDLLGIDVMLFDIQDVGVRYYTFISSLEYYLQAAYAYNIPVLILDRPNPNGHYVAGPVLNLKYKSFVGMQPIPIVYGLTIGEYAYMLTMQSITPVVGTIQLPNTVLAQVQVKVDNSIRQMITSKRVGLTANLTIITCANYTHKSKYMLPVAPSPNLKLMNSIYWYPSTCFIEGTVLSEGRGTDAPFQIFGHPSYANATKGLYTFTPNSNAGAKSSKLFGVQCYGWSLVNQAPPNDIDLKHIITAYQLFPNKDSFFLIPKNGDTDQSFFNKLAGNNTLMKQLQQEKSETEIKKSWKPELDKYKAIRKKYLLYP